MTMTTAHQAGTARMNLALAAYAEQHPASNYVRVAGHAGVWHYDGPCHVLGDEEMFEHPTLVLVHQVVDPERVAVVEANDLTPFAPHAVTGERIAV
jgi:hypothetical protein